MANVGKEEERLAAAFFNDETLGLDADGAKHAAKIAVKRYAGMTATTSVSSTAAHPVYIQPEVVVDVTGEDVAAMTRTALPTLIAGNPRNQEIFVKDGDLWHIGQDEKGKRFLYLTTPQTLQATLRRRARWQRRNENGDTRACDVPRRVVEDMLSSREWYGIPAIKSIIEAPVLRPDGSVLDEAGYDPATRLYLALPEGFDMPSVALEPTQEDAIASRDYLLDIVCDFMFVDDADRENWLASMLTPFASHMGAMPMPGALTTAPSPAQGKSKLLETVQITYTGDKSPSNAPTDSEAFGKKMFAQAISGRPTWFLDNVTGVFGHQSLALAMTGGKIEDRILGQSKNIEAEWTAFVMISGNNCQIDGDLAARLMPIRLDTKTSRSQERTGFKRDDLEGWVREHRGEIIHHVLTILRAWYVAGRPAPSRRLPLGRFRGWHRIVGGAMEFIGCTNLLGNYYEAMKDSLSTGDAMTANFLMKLADITKGKPVMASRVFDIVMKEDATGELKETAPDKLKPYLDPFEGAKFSRQLGMWAKTNNRRRMGDLNAYIEHHGEGGFSFHYDTAPVGVPVKVVLS